jgi:predicted flap endonuclease-1-like 5' DNA nuclease
MANLVLGPSGGNGGHAFEEYTIPAGVKVQAIRVNAGFYVDGLQLICVDAIGAVIALPHLGGRGGFRHTITLDEGEYLTGISGRSGRYIDSIRFHTNKRVTDSIGGHGGENEYHFEAAANGEVAGFFGRADWYIDQLGVVLRNRAAAASPTPAKGPATKVAATKAAAPKSEASASAATKKAAPANETKATKAKPAPAAAPAAAATTPAAKPASKSRKKMATESELLAVPDSPPVVSAAPDLVGVPDSKAVDASAPEYVGVPGATKIEAGAVAAADDLTKIEGIGPKISQVLADAGITTFAALASTSPERLREILNAAGNRYRISDPMTWPEQAGHAARGDWGTFNELVGRLKAGRRV